MGCMGSKRCTHLQQEEIFVLAARQMLYLCIQGALLKADQIQISPPPEVVAIRQTSNNLRSVAGMTKSLLGFTGNLATKGSPAGLGQQFSKIVIEKAGDMVSEMLGSATEQALSLSAGGIDESIMSLGRRLSDAGRQVLTEKHDQVRQLYESSIRRVTFAASSVGALGLVRGKPPYASAQYKACKQDVCKYFQDKAAKNLTAGLAPIAADLVAKHDVMEEWKSLLDKWTQANKRLGECDCAKHMEQQPIDLDLSQYIFEQAVAQLGGLMGREEEAIRVAPTGKSRRPLTFELCFSGFPPLDRRLPIEHYKDRHK